MNITAIDPGPVQSAILNYKSATREVEQPLIADNADIRNWLGSLGCCKSFQLAIEYTPPYAMQTRGGHAHVPRQVVDTAIEIGRFVEAWENDKTWHMVSRLDVKKHLLGRTNGSDSDVRAALLDRYGGDPKQAKGTKKSPGPLYGVSKDLWAALAVAVTWSETR